jgi:hypothetical protein
MSTPTSNELSRDDNRRAWNRPTLQFLTSVAEILKKSHCEERLMSAAEPGKTTPDARGPEYVFPAL